LYVAFASDSGGVNGFSTAGGAYMAVRVTNAPLTMPLTSAQFAGCTWFNVQGPQGVAGTNGTNGTNGASAYVYVAYASDANGTGFSLTPAAGLNYIAVITSPVPLGTPTAANFNGCWAAMTNQAYAEGVIAVTYGSSSGTLNTLALGFTPSRVQLTVSIPAGGNAGIHAVVVGNPTTTGFSWQLSTIAPAAGYQIFYRIT
jgi:hypothetical protein